MNSLERCMAAIRFEKIDRMPVDLHDFMLCAKQSGLKFSEFVLNPEAMADMQIQLYKEYGHDMLLVENGTASLAEAMGCGVIYREDDSPVSHTQSITSLNELDKLKISGKFFESPLIKANLETVRILKKKLGDSVFVMGRGDQGPFSLASQIYGMDNLLMDLMDEECEEQIHQLLEVCTQACITYCNALLDAGAHGTSMGDSTAGPDVLSPQMYEKFGLPYEKKVIDAIHKRNGLISLHICGNATSIIDKMVLTGADILEIDQKTELPLALNVMKDKCAILGPVSPITLMSGTEEEVKSEIKKVLNIIGGTDRTGVIFGPGCALGGTTPRENVSILVTSCRE